MPRKTIHPRHYGHDQERPLPDLTIRWGRDQDVQIGLATPDERGPGTGQHHIVDYWYGDAPTLTEIGRLITRSLNGEGNLGPDLMTLLRDVDAPNANPDAEAATYATIGRVILNAVTGSSVVGDVSWWTDLDRHGCQELIRTARTARDQAYGRDE